MAHNSTDQRGSDRILTPEEVADQLKVPERTLEAWRYRGTGPAFLRVGRHVRYRLSAVEEFLTAAEVTTP